MQNIDFSTLQSLKVIDSNGKYIGRINDALLNKKNLSIRGYVIHGSRWEETLEDLKLKKDVDPLLTEDLITDLTESSISLNKSQTDLINAMTPGEVKENEFFFSELKKIPVLDSMKQQLGIFTNFYINKTGELKYELGGKEFVMFLKKHQWTSNLTYLISPDRITYVESKEADKNGFMQTVVKYQLKSPIKNLEKNIKLHMTNVLRDLMIEANRDGVISDDEKALIDVVSIDLETYYNALELALEDKIITKDEEEILEDLKEKIIKKMHTIATADDMVTAEERALIEKLASFMVDRRKELFWKVFSYYGTSK